MEWVRKILKEMLDFNDAFVLEEKYKDFITTKYPNKKIAILSCMDTRLTELLPAALGFKNGDVKVIKNAGGIISSPFGSVMRSLIVAIYQLEVEEILVIGHTDCGMQNIDSEVIIEKMKSKGISEEKIDMIKYCGIDFNEWLKGFDSVELSVSETCRIIKNHPLIPEYIKVEGLIMDSTTGKVDVVDF